MPDAESQTLELTGYLYDGQSSARNSASLKIDADGMLSSPQQPALSMHYSNISVSSRVGNAARYLELGEHGRFETVQNDDVDHLNERWHSPEEGLADRLERNMKLVFVAVIVVAFGSFAFVRYGIPAASGPIATLVPKSIDRHLGDKTLETMDNRFFKESTLDEARQAELQELFSSLLPEKSSEHIQYQFLIRNAHDMPNAFALPNGTIVMTEALIKLADNDDMLASILMHEIGHVEERHSIQMLVRQASLSILILLITGDVSTISSTLLLIPAWMAQANYSKNLETSADTFALRQMLASGRDPNAFADIMLKMENYGRKDKQPKTKSEESKDTDSRIFDYLSTHPTTEERIKRFRDAASKQQE